MREPSQKQCIARWHRLSKHERNMALIAMRRAGASWREVGKAFDVRAETARSIFMRHECWAAKS
jgi:transposase